MAANHSPRTTPLIAAALFLITLIFYTLTLAPSVVTIFDDSLEFQLVAYRLGIAHPTGYPLYTLLGKLFTLLPPGNVAWRVNWLSAICGAATVALSYPLTLRMAMPRRRDAAFARTPARWPTHVGALLGAMLLALGPIFWLQATIAEVYALNALFVALLLLLAVTLPADSPRRVYALAFVAGLSLAHHRTTLLLLPALALYLLLTGRAALLRPKTLGLALLAGVLPLLLYLYLPLRGHIGSLDGAYQNTWTGFWQQVTASAYGSTFILGNPFNQARDFNFYVTLLSDQFYTTVLGLIGLAFLAQFGQRKYLALTGVAFVTYFTFNIFYNVADIEVFFIPVFLLWAVWSGLGAMFLLATAAAMPHRGWRWGLSAALLALFALLAGRLLQTGLPQLQARNTWQAHDTGIDMLRQPLEPDATVIGILGEMTLLRYFQQTEALRPDVQTLAADAEAERLAAVESALAEGRAVYLTRPLPGAPERWSLSAVGPLIRVMPQPATDLPPDAIPLAQPVTPEISLAGYTISRAPHTGSGPAPLRLTLYWQPQQPIPADLKVSARLLAADGTTLAAVDAVPVHFAYPTPAWRPGEIIADVYDLPLPPDAPPGTLTPLLIWYDPAQNAAEVGRVELPPVTVD
jgi:hypothetical protein